MITADGPEVYGYTIFCDDVRVEVGGKLTYVGAYHGTMIVQGTFPMVLPKFAMHFFYLQRRQPNIIPPTKVLVLTPGTNEDNPAVSIEIPEGDFLKGMANIEAKSVGRAEPNYILLGGPILMTNFAIKEPGEIKVRAVRGEQYIRLGTLQILQDPSFIPPPAKGAKAAENSDAPKT